jgi:hypothetical protein
MTYAVIASTDFTGPGARYSLLGDRVTREPLYASEETSREQRKRTAQRNRRRRNRYQQDRVPCACGRLGEPGKSVCWTCRRARRAA